MDLFSSNKSNDQKDQNQNEKNGFFSRLKNGLKKTRKGFINRLNNLFKGYSSINEELFEELEELLIQSDVGVKTTINLIEELKDKVEKDNISSPEKLYEILQDKLSELLKDENSQLKIKEDKLNIFMVVGVNGVGKTTTIAKIAQRYKDEGKSVKIAAGDTFRAGAIDQMEIWGNRLGVEVISQEEGSDAAAVAYDAVQSAKATDTDLLIVDTAGRLHTQKNLMEELKKVKRVMTREAENAYFEVLLVLDATTGQNAISQAEIFDDAVDVNGIVLTKLDGTAKGGIVIAVKNELGIPIKLIGVGEEAADLQNFDPDEFVDALFTDDS